MLKYSTTIRYLIPQIACVTINNRLLVSDAHPTCFGLYMPLCGRSFTKKHIYNKCYQRCACMDL